MHHPIQLTKTTLSRGTSQTGKTRLHALIAALRPAFSILARRIALPLLFLGAALALIRPCAGQSGTWTPAGSSPPHAIFTQRRCWLTERSLSSGSGEDGQDLSTAELYDPEVELGQPLAASAPNDLVAQQHCCPTARFSVAGGSRYGYYYWGERGALRSGEWNLDVDGQPLSATDLSTRQHCCPTAMCSSQEAFIHPIAPNFTIRPAGPGLPRQPQHRTF